MKLFRTQLLLLRTNKLDCFFDCQFGRAIYTDLQSKRQPRQQPQRVHSINTARSVDISESVECSLANLRQVDAHHWRHLLFQRAFWACARRVFQKWRPLHAPVGVCVCVLRRTSQRTDHSHAATAGGDDDGEGDADGNDQDSDEGTRIK